MDAYLLDIVSGPRYLTKYCVFKGIAITLDDRQEIDKSGPTADHKIGTLAPPDIPPKLPTRPDESTMDTPQTGTLAIIAKQDLPPQEICQEALRALFR